MTKKLIRFDGEEYIQAENLDNKGALKLFKQLNNKYRADIMLHADVGNHRIYLKVKRSAVIEMLLDTKTTRFNNAEVSTAWRITQSRYSLSISGTEHTDFDKTKANNWGEYVEEWGQGCDYCSPTITAPCGECGQEPAVIE